MALDAKDKNKIKKTVLALIENDLGHQLDRFVAYARYFGNKNKSPAQVANEARNAVTHLSRAMQANDINTANSEIALAEKHIERAKRDALKIATINAGISISKTINRLPVIRTSYVAKQVEFFYMRFAIHVSEALGDKLTTDKLLSLFYSQREFLDEIASAEGNHWTIMEKTFRVILGLAKFLFGFISGVLASIIATIFIMSAIPDQKSGLVDIKNSICNSLKLQNCQ